MDYRIDLMYENEIFMLYRTMSDHWFTFDRKARSIATFTEEKAVELVFKSTQDMALTCKILNGELRRRDQEFPQLVALFLTQLDPEQAAELLSTIPDELKADIAVRIALVENVSPPNVLLSVATMEKMSPEDLTMFEVFQDVASSGLKSSKRSINPLVPILESIDPDNRNAIIASIQAESEALASRILEDFFPFEDLLCFDDRGLQMILKEVDVKELTIALKGASQELQERIFANVSTRVKTMIKDEMDYMGPVRMGLVKEFQSHIIEIVRRLEQEQQIVIVRGFQSGDDEFV